MTRDWAHRILSPASVQPAGGLVWDGKIFVLPVERVCRIRTGEEDEAAVTPVAAQAV